MKNIIIIHNISFKSYYINNIKNKKLIFIIKNFKINWSFYSVLSAITGSFLDAAFDGIIPPINVNMTLNIIRINPPI